MSTQAAPIHEDQPRPGWYRYRKHRNAVWEPAFIKRDEVGVLVCRISDRTVDPYEYWTHLAGNKTDPAEVKFAFANGGRWPGDAPAPEGDNNPPSDDPFEQLNREIEIEAARVRAWVLEPHEGKTAADMAANWLTNLRKAEKRVEAAFDAEKAPALAESTRIDMKWRYLKGLAAQIKKLMDERFQEIARKEKKRAQDIADAKAREHAEAQRKEWEAERVKKAALAAQHNIPIEVEQAPLFPVVMAAEPVKVAFGGAQGSKVGLRKKPATAFVEDWSKVVAYYAGNIKVRELCQKLADHDARDGRTIPGAKVI